MKPAGFDGYPDRLGVAYGPYMAVIDRWIDGDTVVVVADAGLDHYPVVAIRLDGVRAPELHEPGGDGMLRFCELTFPPGTHVRLSTHLTPHSRNERRSFTRYVGSLQSTDASINEAIQAEVDRRGYSR